MKTKSIILSGLLLLGIGAATTSCEDMFTAENKLVTTDFAPNDTVYQMLGIVHAMQGVMDQSVLLGEVRADLVDINATTSNDLQELSSNNVSTSNAYNKPANFYNVINNCNIYLANVDTALKTGGDYYYEKEIISTKCFRAWAYLELAKIYGSVPFVTDPVLTANAAEKIVTSTTNRRDLVSICDYFIEELQPLVQTDRNRALVPSYTERAYFIPVRLMLAELYLYRGSFTQSQSDFQQAVINYHDFLAFTDEEEGTNEPFHAYWSNTEWFSPARVISSTGLTYNAFTYIPMDTITYYGGTVSELRSDFDAQASNNYYAPLNPATRFREIANAQQYCYLNITSSTESDTIVGRPTVTELTGVDNPENYVGDLRYVSSYNNVSQSDMYHSEYSKTRQYVYKYSGGSMLTTDVRSNNVVLYRPTQIYLHLAEALNRAGFPETAFAILKYGISESVLTDTTKVSTSEYEGLQRLASNGFASNAADWDGDVFLTVDRFSNYTVARYSYSLDAGQVVQLPIHSYGSGDVWANKNYYLPTDSSGIVEVPVDTFTTANLITAEDTLAHEALLAEIAAARQTNLDWLASDEVKAKRIAALDLMILDEEALALCYEGQRFYDLMRYAKYSGNTGYLGEAISKRKGTDNADAALQSRLSIESNWYLPLPNQ